MQELTTAELAAINAALILYRQDLQASAQRPDSRPTEIEQRMFAEIVKAADSASRKIAARLRSNAGTYR